MRERDPHCVPDLVHEAFADTLANPHRIDDALGCLLRLAAKACVGHDWSRRRDLARRGTDRVRIQPGTTDEDTIRLGQALAGIATFGLRDRDG